MPAKKSQYQEVNIEVCESVFIRFLGSDFGNKKKIFSLYI